MRRYAGELAAVAAATAELAAARGDEALIFRGQKHYEDTVTSLEVREWQLEAVHQMRLLKQRLLGKNHR